MQSHFRPTAAYTASVVLIQSQQPNRAALPVLSRGPVDPITQRDRGVLVVPSLEPTVPVLASVVPPLNQPVARIGDTVDLRGTQLDGTSREVRLVNDKFKIDTVIAALPPPAVGASTLVQFKLDAALASTLPAGPYRVTARVIRPGETDPRETNPLNLILAPQMTNLPLAVARDGGGVANFSIDFMPDLRDGQTVVLALGQQEYLPKSTGSPPRSLTFAIPNAPVGSLLARLRVDGVESPIIDLSKPPPAAPGYLDQRVVIS